MGCSAAPHAEHMKGGIHMSDGSPALVKCAQTYGIPFATVTHGNYEYVKPVKFKQTKLSKDTKTMLMKRPASYTQKHVYALAGDNACEGWFGTMQQSRQRAGKHGRMAGRRGHVNQLAASYLVKNPGLGSVLRALRIYRECAQDCMSPSKVYGMKRETPWLK